MQSMGLQAEQPEIQWEEDVTHLRESANSVVSSEATRVEEMKSLVAEQSQEQMKYIAALQEELRLAAVAEKRHVSELQSLAARCHQLYSYLLFREAERVGCARARNV